MTELEKIRQKFINSGIGETVILNFYELGIINDAWNATHRGVNDFFTEGYIFGHKFIYSADK